MKKLISISAILLTILIAIACGPKGSDTQLSVSNDPVELLRQNPYRAGVTTCPYEWGPYADTPAPKGYKAFYISHYGRHGSRSAWDEPEYQYIVSTLEKAEQAGILTEDGHTLLDVTKQCIELHNGMNGRLTSRGVREHRGIAERMFNHFKGVLKGGNIRAISSTVPRCIVSMTAFTDRLTELDPSLEISWDTGETYMAYIDPASKGEYTKAAQEDIPLIERKQLDTLAYLSTFFSDPDQGLTLAESFRRFDHAVFTVARITASFDIPTNIYDLLPEESIYNNWIDNNEYLYVGHGNSVKSGDLRLAAAGASARDIVEKADAVIEGRDNLVADLRFGHDYPFVAMCSFLGIEGIGQKLSAEEAVQKWFGAKYVPFAANLQIIFYRNKMGEVIVKFLLNERETQVYGIEPVSGPYYRWDDVKSELSRKDKEYRQAVEAWESNPDNGLRK